MTSQGIVLSCSPPQVEHPQWIALWPVPGLRAVQSGITPVGWIEAGKLVNILASHNMPECIWFLIRDARNPGAPRGWVPQANVGRLRKPITLFSTKGSIPIWISPAIAAHRGAIPEAAIPPELQPTPAYLLAIDYDFGPFAAVQLRDYPEVIGWTRIEFIRPPGGEEDEKRDHPSA